MTLVPMAPTAITVSVSPFRFPRQTALSCSLSFSVLHRPARAAPMARRGVSSSTHARHPPLPDSIGEYPLGKHTGLPLIVCDQCGAHTVVELMTKSNEHGNKGRIFFKCPRNMVGVPAMYGTCGFYEWQREYLAKLVNMGLVVLIPQAEHEAIDEVVDSKAVVPAFAVQKELMVKKMDGLVAVLKSLCFVQAAGVLVAAVYVMK